MSILIVVLLSTRKLLQKTRRIDREGNCICRSCEEPKCIPSNDQHICSNDEQHSSYIYLNPYILWDLAPAALMSLNPTNDTYSLSNHYTQPTIRQSRTNSYSVFFSLRTMYKKGRDCASAWHSFEETTYRTDEWTKQLLRLKIWVISGSPEQWMEFRRLWWPVIVFKCGCLFQLFDFYCLLLQFVFENLLFLKTLSEK